MNIAEVQPKTGNIEIVAEVTSKDKPREFVKFGKPGRVCNARIKDSSGEVVLTLWNDQIDNVNVGDKVKISNGWATEWNGEIQLSTGKFGKLEIISGSSNKTSKDEKFVTNDPKLLKGQDETEFIDDDLE